MEGFKIRWMAVGDLDCLGKISEKSGVKIPLLEMTRKSDVICVVSELDGSINGFALYRFCPSKIIIKHLIVDEKFRRMGVATRLITRLFSKMSEKRSFIEIKVSEYNLAAHFFLKAMSFKAEDIIRNCNESEYAFRRHLN